MPPSLYPHSCKNKGFLPATFSRNSPPGPAAGPEDWLHTAPPAWQSTHFPKSVQGMAFCILFPRLPLTVLLPWNVSLPWLPSARRNEMRAAWLPDCAGCVYGLPWPSHRAFRDSIRPGPPLLFCCRIVYLKAPLSFPQTENTVPLHPPQSDRRGNRAYAERCALRLPHPAAAMPSYIRPHVLPLSRFPAPHNRPVPAGPGPPASQQVYPALLPPNLPPS